MRCPIRRSSLSCARTRAYPLPGKHLQLAGPRCPRPSMRARTGSPAGATDAGAPPRGGVGTPFTPRLSRASAETMMRSSCSQVPGGLAPALLHGVLGNVCVLAGQSRLTASVCTAGQAGSRRAGAARSGSRGAWTPAPPSSGSRVSAAQLASALLPCWPCQARHARSRAQDAHPVQRRRHAAQAAGA